MNGTSEGTLEARRVELRDSLAQQRQAVAAHMLAPMAVSGFPRSHLMRWLVQRPQLSLRLALGVAFILARRLRRPQRLA